MRTYRARWNSDNWRMEGLFISLLAANNIILGNILRLIDFDMYI